MLSPYVRCRRWLRELRRNGWMVLLAGQLALTPQQAADILRNLNSPVNMTNYQFVPKPLPRRPHVVVARKAPSKTRPARRRLDGTRVDRPPMVYGFTPHDWQWWYQWELHRE